jgi:hypothetical protein
MTGNTNEHYVIASTLNRKQISWLMRLPYYIQSPDLGCVFVHAGFQANVTLTEQVSLSRTMRMSRSIATLDVYSC